MKMKMKMKNRSPIYGIRKSPTRNIPTNQTPPGEFAVKISTCNILPMFLNAPNCFFLFFFIFFHYCHRYRCIT